jgi:hypothetical protein
MTVSAVLDSAGRRRSPATLPGYHAGRPPRNKGMLYPADPASVEEIVSVMRHASEDPHGWRLRAMIVMLWRGGLRVQEARALSEHDLDPQRGSVLVRHGKGGRRREVGMDGWGRENLRPWIFRTRSLPALAPPKPVPAGDWYEIGTNVATPRSDLDFLVVEPSVDDPTEESIRLRRTLRGLGLVADVVVVSEREAEDWRDVRGSLIHAALSEGRPLAA